MTSPWYSGAFDSPAGLANIVLAGGNESSPIGFFAAFEGSPQLHDRVAAVASTRAPDQVLTFGKVDGKFALTAPAEHPKLEDYKVDDIARGLETLTLQAVKADAEAPGAEASHALFATDDGLAVTVRLFHGDKDVWARFAASASSGKAKAASS